MTIGDTQALLQEEECLNIMSCKHGVAELFCFSHWALVKSSFHLVISDFVFKQRMWPVIPWEISDVTTTAVSQSAGNVMAVTTVVTAQMRGTAVSILLNNLQLSPPSKSHVHQGPPQNLVHLFFIQFSSVFWSWFLCNLQKNVLISCSLMLT